MRRPSPQTRQPTQHPRPRTAPAHWKWGRLREEPAACSACDLGKFQLLKISVAVLFSSIEREFLFPRASERRVLQIVCISSSHLHTFSHICSSSHLLSHLLIFTSAHLHTLWSSHLLIFTFSHLHTFSSSHLLIFTFSHLHTFSSSHLLIFTSAHLHIFSSSHFLTFTPSHLHIFSSSHFLIFTTSHLHICSSSHLLIFTSAHLHICSSSHLIIFTSSHLHIFSSSHLLIFTSAHLHIFTYSHLLFLSLALTSSHTHIFSLSLSLSLSSFLSPFSLSFLSPFSLSRLLYLSLFRPRVVPAGSHETSTLSHETRVDRQKLMKIAILLVLEQPFRTKWGSMHKNWGKIAILLVLEQPFRTKCGRSSKPEEKLRFYLCWSNPFARNEGRWVKTVENCDFTCPGATLSHEMRVDRQKLMKIAILLVLEQRILLVLEQPFRTKWGSIVKNWGKLRFYLCWSNIFARNEGRSSKTDEKCDFTCAGATLLHEMRVDAQNYWWKIAILLVLEQPFRTKWGSIVKNWWKLRFYLCWSNGFYLCWSNPFARNEGRSSKTGENCDFTCAGATLSHEMRVDAQNYWWKIAILLVLEQRILLVLEQPFRTKWGSIVKNWWKLRFYLCWSNGFYLCWSNPFARNEGRSSKTGENCDFTCAGATLSHEMRVDSQKLKKNCDFTCAGATLSHEMILDRQKLVLDVKGCECKSVSVCV